LAALNVLGLKSFLKMPPTISGGLVLAGNSSGALYWEAVKLSNPAIKAWIGKELVPATLGSGIVNFSMVGDEGSGGGGDSGNSNLGDVLRAFF
jgi:hypothetical protein